MLGSFVRDDDAGFRWVFLGVRIRATCSAFGRVMVGAGPSAWCCLSLWENGISNGMAGKRAVRRAYICHSFGSENGPGITDRTKPVCGQKSNLAFSRLVSGVTDRRGAVGSACLFAQSEWYPALSSGISYYLAVNILAVKRTRISINWNSTAWAFVRSSC